MEFGSVQVQQPVKRRPSKEPSKAVATASGRPQISMKKKVSASQDVRENSFNVRAAGTSLVVKRGVSGVKDKDDKPKKKKISKKEELLEKKRLLDEEEEERLMVEERRRYQLERFRKLQADKLTKEEKERLISESVAEEEFQLRFEARVYFEEKRLKIALEWEKYLNCEEAPQPDSERDQMEYVFRYGDQNVIEAIPNIEFYLKKSDYSEGIVVARLIEQIAESKANNKYDAVAFAEKFIVKIRSITTRKIAEITSLVLKNQETVFDLKNTQLIEANKLPITAENIRAISGSVTMKPEERYKYEVFKTFESEDFAIAFWWSPLEKCGYRMKPVDFKRPNVSIDLPRNLNGLPLQLRCLWTRCDLLSQQHLLQKYFITGGVFQIEVFPMVPLIRRTKKYALKMDFGEAQTTVPYKYPPEFTGGSSSLPPLRTTIELPADIYIPKNFSPRVAWFSEKLQQWTEEGIEVLKFDSDLRQVHFTTKILAPLACVQDVCMDFPYISFLLRNIEESKAILDLETKRLKLRFEISSEQVTLLSEPGFEVEGCMKSLCGKPMQPAKLLNSLRRLGVNLQPETSHAMLSAGTCVAKEMDVENKALMEVIMAVKAFAIRSSPRNSNVGEEAVVVQIKQNLDYQFASFASQDDKQNQWIEAAIWCNKCALISQKAKSIDALTQENLLQGSSTHAMLSLVIESHPTIVDNSHDIVERMNDVYVSQFQNNLRRFLKMLRILSFS